MSLLPESVEFESVFYFVDDACPIELLQGASGFADLRNPRLGYFVTVFSSSFPRKLDNTTYKQFLLQNVLKLDQNVLELNQ